MISDRDLARRLAAAREFEHTVGGVLFRLRTPSKAAIARIYARFEGPAAYVEAMAEVLSQSVYGISGATTKDLGLPGDVEELPDTPLAAREYLAEHAEAANEMAQELWQRASKRYDEIDGDLKN